MQPKSTSLTRVVSSDNVSLWRSKDDGDIFLKPGRGKELLYGDDILPTQVEIHRFTLRKDRATFIKELEKAKGDQIARVERGLELQNRHPWVVLVQYTDLDDDPAKPNPQVTNHDNAS